MLGYDRPLYSFLSGVQKCVRGYILLGIFRVLFVFEAQ